MIEVSSSRVSCLSETLKLLFMLAEISAEGLSTLRQNRIEPIRTVGCQVLRHFIPFVLSECIAW